MLGLSSALKRTVPETLLFPRKILLASLLTRKMASLSSAVSSTTSATIASCPASSTVSTSQFDVLLFDLDGCLYDADCGYVQHQRRQLFELIYLKGWVSRDESAEDYWRPLFKKYNQTLRGLKAAGHDIDDAEYWDHCRAGEENFLKEDLPLRSFLESLPKTQKKYIFTNAGEKSAKKCLELMGIGDQFDHVYGSDFMKDVCKPETEAFHRVLHDIDPTGTLIADPTRVCMFEDSYKNLVTADALGMGTVFVESEIHVAEEGVTAEQKAILSCTVNTLSDENGATIKERFPRLFL